MHPSRREALTLALATAGAAAIPAETAGQSRPDAVACDRAPRLHGRPGMEGQRRASLGDGRYVNPVLSGDRPDPSILKDGADYYATFSSFQYYPGIPIWHSRNLIDWTPIAAALRTNIGIVWALDIAKHDGRYFIYIPTLDDSERPQKTFVIHASSMSGPWSEPIDMKLDGFIDPGHAVGEDGQRYLFFNGGRRVRISADGLSAVGPVEHVYSGWPIPDDYVIEGFALEGPKVLRRGEWFYLISGQGGTAGPPTSHMVVVARSRSIDGPWQNCPHNPVVRTLSRDEPWWSRGHGTAVEAPDGSWWLAYHGYENGFRTLGRQMLLEPITWTEDGWPRAAGGDLSTPIAAPRGGLPGPHGTTLSNFSPDMFGTKMQFFDPAKGDYLRRASVDEGVLTLAGQGVGPANSSPLLFVAGDRSYELSVEVEILGTSTAGVTLFYNDKLFCGLAIGPRQLHAYRIGQEERWPPGARIDATRLHIRAVNDENVVTFFYSRDGRNWTKDRSVEVAGYNHNVADGFLSLRPGVFAAGDGRARFRNFRYRARG
ncbi:family 43 glycosylhydrolase [Microvirga sp. SRT01]|uniref:Family 43 glycosylhydrolase n=1 Tax=Sphingomonas longa TaxID=2778730 RepID=A0ABS2DAX0_9SPHN|nr:MULTISPECIES: family 43 glycosylhydrolase [Alphaproteobacteria]MBM6578091.1 family 43 glycosylhydrolase [Sphingomonas sp. BT552]MBR7711132.1 family 43 glycosylhydrolase [Microvirga sp. SRT01]